MIRSTLSLVLIGLLFSGCGVDYELETSRDASAPPTYQPVAVTGPGDAVKRWEQVVLDGTESYDPDDDDATLLYQWDVSALDNAGQYDYDLIGAQSAEPVFSAGTVGSYVLALTVTDMEGNRSQNAAGAVVEILPWEDLSVTLTWDQTTADLDLHLVRPGGSYYGEDDCYYGNPEPDWGTVGDGTDNPTLSNDDERGGPEIVWLAAPEEGTYEVLVHYFFDRSDSGTDVVGSVAITGEGEELASVTSPTFEEGDVWKVGTLDWSSLTFTQDGSLTTHSLLGGPDVNE